MDYMEYEFENESGFKRRYRVFVFCLIAVLIVVWAVLFYKLFDYQNKTDASNINGNIDNSDISAKNQTDNLMETQEFCLDYINSLDDSKWIYIYRENNPDCIDSDEDIVNFLRENVYPYKSSVFRAYDYSDDAPAFCMGAKDKAVASFVFSQQNDAYELKDAKIFVCGNENITIKTFADASVAVNGIIYEGQPESEEYATVDGYEEELINPISMNSYTISGVINPDVNVSIDNSFETFDNFYYPLAEGQDELISKSEEFVKTLLRYYSQGKNNIQGNMSAVLALVDSSSEAAKVIRNTESGMEWVPADNSISLEVSCNAVCRLADNCIFAEVNCESGNIYRVYYLDTGSGYKIVQFACVL